MPTVLLGNTAPVEVTKAERGRSVRYDRTARPDLGNTVTTVAFPAGMGLDEQLRTVGELWPWHSDDPPEWVESDDDLLAQVVARRFSADGHECRVGRPDGWREG